MRIALIDADFLPYYVCHNKKGEKEKTFEEACAQADLFINNIFKATAATHYVMAWTVGKKTCFRYTIDPQYKANRKYTQVLPFLKELKEYLMNKYNAVFDENLEADDIVRVLKKMPMQFTLDDHKEWVDQGSPTPLFFIVSPDKDILKLEGEHFNPREMKWVVTSKDDAEWNFWTSMVTGDTIDGIKGIPKKGIKFVQKLIKDKKEGETLAQIIFREYLKHFGEHEGIEEFYKNYKLLRIVGHFDKESKHVPLTEARRVETSVVDSK